MDSSRTAHEARGVSPLLVDGNVQDLGEVEDGLTVLQVEVGHVLETLAIFLVEVPLAMVAIVDNTRDTSTHDGSIREGRDATPFLPYPDRDERLPALGDLQADVRVDGVTPILAVQHHPPSCTFMQEHLHEAFTGVGRSDLAKPREHLEHEGGLQGLDLRELLGALGLLLQLDRDQGFGFNWSRRRLVFLFHLGPFTASHEADRNDTHHDSLHGFTSLCWLISDKQGGDLPPPSQVRQQGVHCSLFK